MDRAQVRAKGLIEFVERAWSMVDPAEFRRNWHHDLMCEYLERLYRGEIRKLAIMIPPGTTKSLICQVFFPVWCWIQDPSESFIYATYEATLCHKFARKMRRLVMGDWFQERWPEVTIAAENVKTVGLFETTAKGFRFSTGIGGAVTGNHAGIHALDDPNKAQAAIGNAAMTLTELNKAHNFFTVVLPTRRTDPATTRTLCIQQRLHHDDVLGRWVRNDPGVTVLCLPMEYNPEHPQCCEDDPRTTPGELLWPAHIPLQEVEELKKSLGPIDAAAQLGQLPGRLGGEIFALSWLGNYWTQLRTKHISKGLISADLTFGSTNDNASYVAIGAWARVGAQAFKVDHIRKRMGYLDTKAALRLFRAKHPWVDEVWVENKALGPAVLEDLASEIPGLIPGEPGSRNKLARALSITGYWKAGDVLLPHPSGATLDGIGLDASWVPDYTMELNSFTGSPLDVSDQVDETSQALTALFKGGSASFESAMDQVILEMGL